MGHPVYQLSLYKDETYFPMLVFCERISSRNEIISAFSENCLSSLMRFIGPTLP